MSEDQNLVYVLVDGFHQIIGYRVGANRELTQLTATSVPAGAAGIGAF